LSYEGIHGIFQRLIGRDRWTLTRPDIPLRPATITPYVPARVAEAADATVPILSIRHVSKRFGSIVTQSDVSFDMSPPPCTADRPNGAGKTTLFNL